MRPAKSTAQQFAENYAQRSSVELEWLADHFVARRCWCDYEECDGWAMISKESAAFDQQLRPLPRDGVVVAISPTADRLRGLPDHPGH
jgi:hypothetical protein